MDTQIVRHDAPYNIICGNNGDFALHIATLIVVKERMESRKKGSIMSEALSVSSYPVVGGSYDMDGQVWMKTEQKDCLVICRQNESVSLYTLKKVMSYCEGKGGIYHRERVLSSFVMALVSYGLKMILPTDNKNRTITDYKVCLEFETGENGIRCMTYSSKDSHFYFYEYYADDTADYSSIDLRNRTDAIKRIVRLRDAYIQMFKSDGLRSITFTTKKNLFKDFVDELNSYKVDARV